MTAAAQLKKDIATLSINTIRTLSLDAIQKANSGHPGLPLGMAPAAYVLWTKFLRHNPKNPQWFGRDRFLQSTLGPGDELGLIHGNDPTESDQVKRREGALFNKL